MKIYATVGDTIQYRKNEHGEDEPYTVEGEVVIKDIEVSDSTTTFAKKYEAIKALYPGAAVRFMKVKGAG